MTCVTVGPTEGRRRGERIQPPRLGMQGLLLPGEGGKARRPHAPAGGDGRHGRPASGGCVRVWLFPWKARERGAAFRLEVQKGRGRRSGKDIDRRVCGLPLSYPSRAPGSGPPLSPRARAPPPPPRGTVGGSRSTSRPAVSHAGVRRR